MPARPNATRADIIAMLKDGHSNLRISRDLRCDKARVAVLRIELGLPNAAQQPLTLEEKWRARTRPLDGGHLEWTGERAKTSGTPVMRYKEGSYSPAAIAFEIRHGQPPKGYVRADCDVKHCIAPDHVNDEAGRHRARLEARERNGLGELPARCVYGHDMAEHGKLEPDGRAYCGMCKVLDKRAQRDSSLPRRSRPRPATLEEAFRARTELVDGGHLRWTGSSTHGTPAVRFGNTSYSAYKVAFRLQHGREPEGLVTSTCDVEGCVSGWHVADQPMRQKTESTFAAIFGSAV